MRPFALIAIATATLAACGPHVDQPLPPRSDSAEAAPRQTKPTPPLRLPGQAAPGPVWKNPDGTYGALK